MQHDIALPQCLHFVSNISFWILEVLYGEGNSLEGTLSTSICPMPLVMSRLRGIVYASLCVI
jgi:hypothetical protein